MTQISTKRAISRELNSRVSTRIKTGKPNPKDVPEGGEVTRNIDGTIYLFKKVNGKLLKYKSEGVI